MATPDDELAFTGPPPMLFPPEVDEVHVSLTFTWDAPRAEWLAFQWEPVGRVTIGGPGTGQMGFDFVAGKYLKPGYTITSRGCPNACWFCSAWRREGPIRELPIVPGWNVLDDNLLACSETHIRQVFQMLSEQDHRAEFTGGLEAKRLRPWHVELLSRLRPNQMFFAYDTPDDEEPLRAASPMLLSAGFDRHHMRCYVLMGYPKDTVDEADKRLMTCVELGFYPYAMLWKDGKKHPGPEWTTFQRSWARPALINRKLKELQKA